MLLGRRRRTDIYPDADTFFTARTGRRLWSSRADLRGRRRRACASLELPNDIPDFLRLLIVWKLAFETTDGDGRRLFGDRYVLLRLEDLRADPARRARAASTRRLGRATPAAVAEWAAENIRTDASDPPRRRPAWARAVALLEMEPELERAGYGEIAALEPAPRAARPHAAGPALAPRRPDGAAPRRRARLTLDWAR